MKTSRFTYPTDNGIHEVEQALLAYSARRVIRQAAMLRDNISLYRMMDQGSSLAAAPFVPGNLNTVQLRAVEAQVIDPLFDC